jgi:hypothetical protein
MIQPFDQAKFDRRYKDIFKPAIERAGFEADRVDEDPSVTVVIDRIEKGINDSSVCLAEITTDNANVWFELGYALARKKPVVMICEKHVRTKFPFDVQHRNILEYDTGSRSDYEELETKIVERLKAIPKTGTAVEIPLDEIPKKIPDLSQHEKSMLNIVAHFLPTDTGFLLEQITLYHARAIVLSPAKAQRLVKQLCEKELLVRLERQSESPIYQITSLGWTIVDNLPPLKPKESQRRPPSGWMKPY